MAKDAKFCSRCGEKVGNKQGQLPSDEDMTTLLTDIRTPAVPMDTEPSHNVWPEEEMSGKEFFDRYAAKNTKGWATAMVVICFLTAAVSIAQMLLLSIWSAIDAAFYVAMGVLLLSRKKWIYALLPTLYSILGSVLALALGGKATGIVALIIGIMSTISLRRGDKEYQAYKTSHCLPEKEI